MGLVDVGPDRPGAGPHGEVGVLALDVRVIFPLAEDGEAGVGARAREGVRRRVDAAPLGSADHPREVIDPGGLRAHLITMPETRYRGGPRRFGHGTRGS